MAIQQISAATAARSAEAARHLASEAARMERTETMREEDNETSVPGSGRVNTSNDVTGVILDASV